MIKVPIKPLSVNGAWKGQRYRTDEYKCYAQHLSLLLPNKIDIPDGKLEIHFRFYFSSEGSDYDNPIKPAQDVICKKYGIQDNKFYRATIEKHLVKKGQERIEFKIIKLGESYE